MNTWNCPPGYATDELIILPAHYAHSNNTCTVYLPVYTTLFSLLTAFRTLLSYMQIHIWMSKNKTSSVSDKQGHGGGRRKKKRLPIVPSFGILTSVSLLLFTILTSQNIANSSNNGSAALICFFFIPTFVAIHFSVTRIITLGKKLIPLSQATLELTNEPSKIQKLDERTPFIHFLHFVANITFITNPISILIFGFIFPGNYVPVALGFACYMFQCFLMTSGFVYQYQRVIRAIKTIQLINLPSSQRPAVNNAVKRLRQQQVVYTVIGSLGTAVWFAPVFKLVPFSWW